MTRIGVFNFCALLVVFLYYVTEIESFEPPSDNGHKEASPMWFGPRLGRKKRYPGDEIKSYRNDREQVLFDTLKDTPVLLVALDDVNKHTFTPRLGRESGENQAGWPEDVDMDGGDQVPGRTIIHYSPRLGRNNFNPFSPRLGRDSDIPAIK